MNGLLFWSYIFTISAIIASPGPNAVLMVSHALKYGKRALLLNASGSVCAAALLMVSALAFIGQTIPDSALPYLALIGASYLIYLGSRHIFSGEISQINDPPKKSTHFFLQSFLTGISNPKDILFFVVFLPQFIDKSISFMSSAIWLVLGWVGCDFSIMMLYGWVTIHAGQRFSDRFIVKMTKVMGGIIAIVGVCLWVTSLKQIVL